MNINDLYQDTILEHNRAPRNHYRMKNATNYYKGINPFCGDIIEVFCYIEENKIKNISFWGNGCAISKASASIMMHIVKGYTIKNTIQLLHLFHEFLINPNKNKNLVNLNEKISKALLIFKGVKRFPSRIKCATLAWHTLKSAIENI